MLLIFYSAKYGLASKGGSKFKLCFEDMLLVTFEYIWEYWTCVHVAVSYGVCESSIYRVISWVGNILIIASYVDIDSLLV